MTTPKIDDMSQHERRYAKQASIVYGHSIKTGRPKRWLFSFIKAGHGKGAGCYRVRFQVGDKVHISTITHLNRDLMVYAIHKVVKKAHDHNGVSPVALPDLRVQSGN